jgi:hypothetical protein
MNFALPALIALLALLPGVLFVRAYLSGPFSRRLSLVSPVSEFALYFVVATPLLVGWVGWCGGDHGSVLVFALRALTGTIQSADVSAVFWFSIQETQSALIDYFLLLAASIVGGFVASRIAWAAKLDLMCGPLRMKMASC